MPIHLFEILYSLLNRTDLPLGQRISLVCGYYLFLLKAKFKLLPEDGVPFSEFKIFHRSFSNLRMMLKDTFFYGEYRLSRGADPKFIIDCGGNIGVTVLFFKARYPQAKVLVFEPEEKNCAILQKNISENHLSDVTVVRAAVANHVGELKFWDNLHSPTSSTAVPTWVGDKTKYAETSVPAVRLSSYIEGPVDALKLDIEGGEGLVLEDLEQSGKIKEVREIVMEFHADPRNEKNRLASVVGILERNGFTIVPYGMTLARAAQDYAAQKNVYHYMLNARRVPQTTSGI